MLCDRSVSLLLRDLPWGRDEMGLWVYWPAQLCVLSDRQALNFWLHTSSPGNSSPIFTLFESFPLPIHLPHHKPISRKRPRRDPTKQQTQAQTKGDMER
jgi:hypothetical protein